jgi:excinuclease ABC subunit C
MHRAIFGHMGMADVAERIRNLVRALPSSPGVYQYFDADGTVIYVGKAKDLRKRVSSYFTKDRHENRKTTLLVRKIADIRHIVVETEFDALLLENSLIKEHRPRYNVLLRDDKTYPWICLKKEPFPRIFPTRNPVKDGSQYFGPYASVKMMHTLLELIRQLYPLRTCSLNLTKGNIEAGKFKVCLEYHIGNCKGPCIGEQTEEEHDKAIAHIRHIIRGNIREVREHLRSEMARHAEALEFEEAQAMKQKLDLLVRYQARSTVVSPVVDDAEVYGMVSDARSAYVNHMRVVEGAIVRSHTVELRKRMDEEDADLLALGMAELIALFGCEAKEVIVPFVPSVELSGITITIPQKGDRHKLLKLSERNALNFKREKDRQTEMLDPDRNVDRIMEQMRTDLRMNTQPRHIECFDNSNFHGDHAVAAMVCFRNGKPAKSDYRHYNIRTVQGPDDFASMEEVVLRRYKRLLEEGKPLPDLVIVDGGKGQLSSAVKSLDALGLRGKVAIIGIAKRLEEVYFPEDPVPLYIDKRSETLKVIQHARNEAHRFGITHHRDKRSKAAVRTELTDIPGIGPATAQRLLSHFRSVKAIREAGEEELAEVVGSAKASAVRSAFGKDIHLEN